MSVMGTLLLPWEAPLSRPEPTDKTPPPRPLTSYQFQTDVQPLTDPFDVVQLVTRDRWHRRRCRRLAELIRARAERLAGARRRDWADRWRVVAAALASPAWMMMRTRHQATRSPGGANFQRIVSPVCLTGHFGCAVPISSSAERDNI
jgi:hypothetical protein